MKNIVGLALACAVLASCGKSDSGGGGGAGPAGGGEPVKAAGGGAAPATGGQPGGATPQEIFEKLKTAAIANDGAQMYDCIEPDTADVFVGTMTVFSAFLGMKGKEVADEHEAILKKHGIVPPKEGEAPPMDMNDEAKMNEAMKKFMKDVKDKRGLARDIMAFLDKHSDKKDSIMPEGSVLKDLKETGDTAEGKVVRKDGKEEPIKFSKKDGRWYVVLDMK